MTEVQYMREIENLEARNRKLSEALTACKIEVNKYGIIMDQAANEIEHLRLALEVAANDLDDWGAYTKAKNARAALEGKHVD